MTVYVRSYSPGGCYHYHLSNQRGAAWVELLPAFGGLPCYLHDNEYYPHKMVL